MTNSYANVLAEADFVLQHSEIKNKIPSEILIKISKLKNNDYKVMYDVTKPLSEQKLSKKALKFLSELYLEYCVSEEKKEELLKTNKKNFNTRQAILSEKYSIDKVFKNNKVKKEKEYEQDEEIKVNNLAIKTKEGIWCKFKRFIDRIFNKN